MNWINVNDEMPKEYKSIYRFYGTKDWNEKKLCKFSDEVLVYFKYDHGGEGTRIAKTCDGKWLFRDSGKGKVTHWMPLPEEPQEGLIMENLINLPKDIKQGTTILVRDNDYDEWSTETFVCTYNNKVYVEGSAFQDSLIPYLRAKMPEIDWNEIPIGTRVVYWDEYDDENKNQGYLVAVINGVPFCSNRPVCKFNNGCGGYTIQSWDNVEIVEED